MHPREIVVGDVCLLDEYATISCDGVLLEGGRMGRGLVVDETVLGRHEPLVKVPLAVAVKEKQRLPD